MRTNREIRAEAWRLLWERRWLGRLAVGGLLLLLVIATAIGALNVCFGATVSVTPEPSALQLALYLFRCFIQYLFTGLMLFGFARLTLLAARDRPEGWLREAFAGFQRPFSVCWLSVDVQLRTLFWLLAALLPTIAFAGLMLRVFHLPISAVPFLAAVPASVVYLWTFYRYFLVWYRKSDNPDATSWDCVRYSIETMAGWKRRAVGLDCSYWPWFLLFLPPAAVFGWCALTSVDPGIGAISSLQWTLAGVSGVLTVVLSLFLGCCMTLAHGLFYEALRSEKRRDVNEG